MKLKCKKDYFYDVEPETIRGIETIYFREGEYYDVIHDSANKLHTVLGIDGYYVTFRGTLEYNFKYNETLYEYFYTPDELRNDKINTILQ